MKKTIKAFKAQKAVKVIAKSDAKKVKGGNSDFVIIEDIEGGLHQSSSFVIIEDIEGT